MTAAGAYNRNGVFSEPFRSHAAALAAARRGGERAAGARRTEVIEYETADGKWQTETAAATTAGNDVEDTA